MPNPSESSRKQKIKGPRNKKGRAEQITDIFSNHSDILIADKLKAFARKAKPLV